MTLLDSAGPQGLATLDEARRQQARRIVWLVSAFVLAPTFAAGVYYGIVASPTFVSTATFTVDTAAGGPPGPNLPQPETDVGRDSLIVRDYLRSRDALRALSDRPDFRAAYRASSIDRFSRLPENASFETTYDYYLDHVNVDLDSETGFLKLHVSGHSAASVHRLAVTLLEAGEAKVRSINATMEDGLPRRLVRIAEPSTPDRPSAPIVWREVATWALGTMALLVIGWILVATAREHAI